MRSPVAAERERVTTLFFYCVLLLLGYLLFRIFAPFLGPLGWAAVLAIFVFPWHEKLVVRYGPARAAGLSTLIVTLLIVGPGLLLLTAFVNESRAALAHLDRDVLTQQAAGAERTWERLRVLIPGAPQADLGISARRRNSKGGRLPRAACRRTAGRHCRVHFPAVRHAARRVFPAS